MDGGAWGWVAETPATSLAILGFGTLWFILYYIDQYRRWGVLSMGAWIFGFDFYAKIVLLYPFARAPDNVIAVAHRMPLILAELDNALFISAAGVLAMIFGLLASGAWAPTRFARPLDALHDVLRDGWCSRHGALAMLGLALGSTALLFLLGFQPFVARALVFERPELRPVYNLWSQFVPFAALGLLAFGLGTGRRAMALAGVAVAMIGVIGGNRTVVIVTLAQAFVLWAMPRREGRLWLPIAAGLALGTLALLVSQLRSEARAGGFGTLDELLYGNQLSDLRDFAWVLSGLHGGYYGGLTYLAGYLAFIPTALLDFRFDAAFGRVTAALAGLDPARHGGLRTPIFGELYVNFAMPGVLVGSFLFGLLLGRILRWVSHALSASARHAPHVAVWTGFLAYQVAVSLMFTPAFFGVYVLGVLVVIGIALRRWFPAPRAAVTP